MFLKKRLGAKSTSKRDDEIEKKKTNVERQNSASRNNEDRQLEEYDIRSVISGLTRDSQFKGKRDPPESESNHMDLRDSSLWPDDESYDQTHVIHIFERDRVQQSETSTVKLPAKLISDSHQNQCPQKSCFEPIGRRFDSPTKESDIFLSNFTQREGCEVKLLQSEPNGMRLGMNNDDEPQNPVEPFRTKLQATGGSKLKKKKPSRSIVVLPDDHDVEVVYGESISCDGDQVEEGIKLIEEKKKKEITRRGRVNLLSCRTTNGNHQRCESKKKDHHLGEVKKRSRSLPRTFKRFTSRYRKNSQENKVDRSKPKGFEIKEQKKDYVNSHHDKCDPPQFEQLGRDGNDWRREFAGISQAQCESFETKTCVEFARRQSGGYFQRSCYSDQKSSNTNNENRVRTTVSLDRNAAKQNLTRQGTTMTRGLPSDHSSNERKANKLKVRTITEEASRNLLLVPDTGDKSNIVDCQYFTETHTSISTKGAKSLDNRFTSEKDYPYNKSVTGKDNSIHQTTSMIDAVPVTPSPGNKSSRTLSNYNYNDVVVSSLAKTSAGRKSLIQRYLELRESLNEKHIIGPSPSTKSASINGNCFDRTLSDTVTAPVKDIYNIERPSSYSKARSSDYYGNTSRYNYNLTEATTNSIGNTFCNNISYSYPSDDESSTSSSEYDIYKSENKYSPHAHNEFMQLQLGMSPN